MPGPKLKQQTTQATLTSSSLSTQAAGTLLALLFVYVIYQINRVLSDFRDPIFYSILCSTALRFIKDRIVSKLTSVTSDPNTSLLFQPFVLLLYRPVELVIGAWSELKRLAHKFRSSLVSRRQRGSARGVVYAYAFADTIRSIRNSSSAQSLEDDGGPVKRKTSSVLLRVLAKLVALQLALRWIKTTLSAASQVALLSIVVTIGVGAATVSFVPYTSLGPLSPHKSRTPASKRKRTWTRSSIDNDDEHDDDVGSMPGRPSDVTVVGCDGGDTSDDDGSSHDGALNEPSRARILVDKLVAPILSFDSVLKRSIALNAHSLVSAVLILLLVLGSAISATFLGYQIISECRDVGLSLKDALSDLGNAGGQRSDDFLSEYRLQANEVIQEYLPTIFDWVESKSDYILQANNLTAAAMEGRLLMEQIRGPRYCSRDEREKLLVSLARAASLEARCKRDETRLAELLAEKTFEFSTALRRFENKLETEHDEDHGELLVEAAADAREPGSLEGALVDAEDQLKLYHGEYADASSNLAKAQRAKTVAERRLVLCSLDNIPSSSSPHVSWHHLRSLQDVGAVIQGGLTKIFTDRDVSGGVADTWSGLNGILHGLFPNVARNESAPKISSSTSSAAGENIATGPGASTGISHHIDSLQSVVQAATGPLVSVGKALFLSTSAALIGTSSLFRLGASLFQFGMQSLIFLSLLFALLSAEEDPLTSMIYHLPFPPAARDKAAIALNRSLGGVFVTLIKLCVIHGLFTWVTFTFFDAPLVYLTSTVSAAFSIVPFIPSYMVVIPSVTALAVQGRILSGIILLGLHFAAYSFGDTEILNEAGGQPYLMSLSVFGGLYAMPANPFLGAMAGPVFFSLGQALVTLMGEL